MAFALSGGPSTTTALASDDLPSFEAYLAVKYPNLRPGAKAELMRRFDELAEQHAIPPDDTRADDRETQQ